MPSYQSRRAYLRKEVARLRHELNYTWTQIAKVLDINSAGTVRKLYGEAGFDPHTDLSGQTTRKFEPGDWCKDTCIAAPLSASCSCRCERVNHGMGAPRVIEILQAKGASQEEIDRKVAEISALQSSL